MENLARIEHLLLIFSERDEQRVAHNQLIAEELTPSVLGAIVELFDLPNEHVVWHDFMVDDAMLMIRAAITYDPSSVRSPLLSLLTTAVSGNEPVQVQKMIQFGFPLAMVYSDKEQIKKWLMDTAKDQIPDLPPAVQQEQGIQFDSTKLTKEQLSQVLYFQTMNGVKQ